MLALIVKPYKTISIKNNLKQNIAIPHSIAHGSLNIFTADMINDLKSIRSKTSSKSSHQLSTITENPLDESSFNPNDTTDIPPNPTGIISPPRFFTKNLNRISKMTSFKFLPKRIHHSNHPPHNTQSKSNTHSSLPHYSSVTTDPNDYPLNTSLFDSEMDTPVRIYSKTNYSFPLPSFNTDHSDFFTPPT